MKLKIIKIKNTNENRNSIQNSAEIEEWKDANQ